MPGRHWSPALKARVVLEGLRGRPEADICERHGIKPSEYRRWRRQFLANAARPFEAAKNAGPTSLFTSLGKIKKEVPETLRVARELIEALPIPVFFKARDGTHLGANKAWEVYFGVSRDTFVGKKVEDLFAGAPEVAARHHAVDDDLWRNPGARSYELLVPVHDGSLRYTLNYKATFNGDDGKVAGLIGTIVDITERKRAELRQAIEHRVTQLLAESASVASAMPGILAAFCESLGWTCGARWSMGEEPGTFRCEETWSAADPEIDEFLSESRKRVYYPGRGGFVRRVLGTGRPMWIADLTAEKSFLRGERAVGAGLASGFAVPIRLGDEVLGAMEFFHREKRPRDEWVLETGAAIGVQVGQFMARKQAESELRESEERFRSLTALSSDWYWQTDEEHRFTSLSGGFFEHTSLRPEEFLGKTRWETEPVGLTPEEWAAHRVLLDAHRPFQDFEYGRESAGGELRYISTSGEPIFDDAGKFRGYRGVGRDITERKRAQAVLRAAYDELARSNAELQQFAYVASHDLQEPLRMVASYTQLLEKRYGDRLDQDAREFMDFIVDGATRMKQLIEDLLAYSRVGTRGKELRPVQSQAALDKALVNLRAAIESAGASIAQDALPEVNADDTQLVQLFQNLVGNAIKFRKKDEPPRIHVGAEDAGNEWRFCVADNGIGIEPQYFERIFMVFQRLHTRDEYAGTGIGLAICKKVVDRHGGRIWVESARGKGSKFYFTLPKVQKGET